MTANRVQWCEHCRGHFPTDHYDDGGDGSHMSGIEYGPVGYWLACVEIVKRLVAGDEKAVEDAKALEAARVSKDPRDA